MSSSMSPEEARRRVTNGTVRLLRLMPYLSAGLLAAEKRISQEAPVAACDMEGNLYFNPDALPELGDSELKGVICHEFLHFCLDHHNRRRGRDPKLWNMACDYAINSIVMDVSRHYEGQFISLPGLSIDYGRVVSDKSAPFCALHPRQEGWDSGLSAEKYYKLLEEKREEDDQGGEGQGQGQEGGEESSDSSSDQSDTGDSTGSASDGVIKDWEQLSEGQDDSVGWNEDQARGLRNKIADKISSIASRSPVPGGLTTWAGSFLKPSSVPWERVLRRKISSATVRIEGNQTTSFSRLHRRVEADIENEILSPIEIAYRKRAVLVADVSGSVSEKMRGRFISEVCKIFKAQKGGSIPVIPCAARVFNVQKNVRSARGVDLSGSGGTDMRVGIEAALRLKPKPNIIIVLTDGFTPWPTRRLKGAELICATIAPAGTHANVYNYYPPPSWALKVNVDL